MLVPYFRAMLPQFWPYKPKIKYQSSASNSSKILTAIQMLNTFHPCQWNSTFNQRLPCLFTNVNSTFNQRLPCLFTNVNGIQRSVKDCLVPSGVLINFGVRWEVAHSTIYCTHSPPRLGIQSKTEVLVKKW